MAVTARPGFRRPRQVLARDRNVLLDQMVCHIFQIEDGLITRFDIGGGSDRIAPCRRFRTVRNPVLGIDA